MGGFRHAVVAALAFGAAATGVASALAAAIEAPQTETEPSRSMASDPAGPDRQPSGVVARLAVWVAARHDNAGLPFMVVDKLAADVVAFDPSGRLLAQAPVLVGLAPGDGSAPGVGDLALSAISPEDRTTPAGRFVAKFGPSDGHGTVLWIDYADSISMHPVITTNPAEHRLERIASASPEEHRISFGCINVPAAFYQDVVVKAFGGGGVVYVLPDTEPLSDVFPAFVADDVAGDADIGRTPQPDRCGDPLDDPLLSSPDRAPTPSSFCPAGDQQAAESAGAP